MHDNKFSFNIEVPKDILERQILGNFNIRPLLTQKDYEKCSVLQKIIWGKSDTGSIPTSIIKINTWNGGVSSGIFNKKDTLLGFIYSTPSWRSGKPYHWSLRLGIHPDYQSLKFGYHLKMYQKEVCLSLGIKKILWTFDPLESRNAYFNLHKLGGVIKGYVKDVYPESKSILHQGFNTDRFIIEWNLKNPNSYDLVAAQTYKDTPSLVTPPQNRQWPSLFKIFIPRDIQVLKSRSPLLVKEYNKQIRTIFTEIPTTYDIVNFVTNNKDKSFYLIKKRTHQ